MKRFFWIMIIGLWLLNLSSCAKLKEITRAHPSVLGHIAVSGSGAYSGPKAKIIVADFDTKAVKASAEMGKDLRSMLASELKASNHFLLVEPQALSNPQVLATSDLIISVTVSEFEPQASGGSAGVGGGGGVGSGALGGLLSTGLNKAHIGLDIRIVDVATSQVLATTQIKTQASDVLGSIAPFMLVSPTLAGDLSAYANTPMEKAIRISVNEAVQYILKNIKPNYYKY